MASRTKLQEKLEELLPGISVYYQPPSRLDYPCLVYELESVPTYKANNKTYKKDRGYLLTYYSLDPDPTITTTNGEQRLVEDVLLELPMCRFDRSYIADNVHHYSFTLFF